MENNFLIQIVLASTREKAQLTENSWGREHKSEETRNFYRLLNL